MFLNEGNLFTTPFYWIFGKLQFLKNCWHEFHFCQCEIDYTTFTSAFFCQRNIIWVRKICSFYWCLTTCQKIGLITQLILEKKLTHHFASLWVHIGTSGVYQTGLTTPSKNEWANLLVLWMSYQIKKFSFITSLMWDRLEFKKSCISIALRDFRP